MNKSDELKNSILLFVDEAIGFRKSLHHFHRWLVTENHEELVGLIVEVCRERDVDIWPLLNAVLDGNDEDGLAALQNQAARGFFVPAAWVDDQVIKLEKLEINLIDDDMQRQANKLWALRDWINLNAEKNQVNVLSLLALAHQLIVDARYDFYKIFELLELFVGSDTLLSCIIDDSILKFGDAVSKYYSDYQQEHIKRLAVAVNNNQDLNWKDALSRNQVKSKLWLLDRLVNFRLLPKTRSAMDTETTTIIVGGWVGMLPFLASLNNINLDNVINVDIDSTVHDAAMELNTKIVNDVEAGKGAYRSTVTHNDFRNSPEDIRNFDFSRYKKVLLIDTIVEHFENHSEWVKSLPKNITVILQGNDMFDVPDHVNCHHSLEEFEAGIGLPNTLWSGELLLYKCTRFMAIGRT